MSAWTVPGYAGDWAVPGYTEERELGRGASGRVVEAVNDATGRRVAIKYLSPALLRDPVFMWDFRTEAETLRSLDVPQVVQVYDYVEAPGPGRRDRHGAGQRGLAARDDRAPRAGQPRGRARGAEGLAARAGRRARARHRPPGLQAGERPGRRRGTTASWRTSASRSRRASRRPSAGTPLYMAPEQWHGAPADPATDIYAATAVFFECLTGTTPFSGKLVRAASPARDRLGAAGPGRTRRCRA